MCRPHCQQGCAPGTAGTAPGAGGFRAVLQLCPSFLPVSQTGVKRPHQHQTQGRAAFQTGQWTLLTKGTTDALGSLPVFPPCEALWRSDATQAPGRRRRDGEGLLYPHPFRLHILETESTWYYLAFGPQEKKKNQHILGRSLPIPAQSHLSTEEKKSSPVRVELHCHIHHSELYQFLYFFCTMKSKVHTLILLTLTPLSK